MYQLQEVSQVVDKASSLLISSSPAKLLSSLKFLLASTVETKETYHQHKVLVCNVCVCVCVCVHVCILYMVVSLHRVNVSILM